MDVKVEICCGSYYDALKASHGGAKRIELNSALHLGGLTPSTACVKLVKENTDLEVISMVRPRGAGFCYLDDEYVLMKQECNELMKAGSDGIAFGFLTTDCLIDEEKTKEFVNIIHKYNGTAVFHRAFDCALDVEDAIQTLIDLGVDRILTSGTKDKAMQGIDTIALLQQKYGHQIEILPGSGLNKTNAKEMIEKTGVHQIHSSCKAWIKDPTTTSNGVTYNYSQTNQDEFEVVDQMLVEGLLDSLK